MPLSWVYILTNRPNGILYTGVTTNLVVRIWQHREGEVGGFTQRYNLQRLVYFEEHAALLDAIQREKNMKHWPRAWNARLTLEFNPAWTDLYDSLL